jgi:hypothetical protein
MTAQTATLADFLLARIAEDEAPTWNLVPYDCAPDCCAPDGWVGHECAICQTREFGGTVEAITAIAIEHDEKIHGRSRVLAECEAKRRIVELHRENDHDGWGSSTCEACLREWAPGDPGENMQWEAVMEPWPCPTIHALASVYADHPDFQQAEGDSE